MVLSRQAVAVRVTWRPWVVVLRDSMAGVRVATSGARRSANGRHGDKEVACRPSPSGPKRIPTATGGESAKRAGLFSAAAFTSSKSGN